MLVITQLEKNEFISRIQEKVGKGKILLFFSHISIFSFSLLWLRVIYYYSYDTYIIYIILCSNFKENFCFCRKYCYETSLVGKIANSYKKLRTAAKAWIILVLFDCLLLIVGHTYKLRNIFQMDWYCEFGGFLVW